MKNILILSLIMMMIACQPTKEENGNEDTKVSQLFSDYYEEYLKLYPISATETGDPRYNDRLPIYISENFRDSLRDFYSDYLTQLEAIDRGKLSHTNQVSYDVLKWECNIQLGEFSYPTHLMPINQFYSLPNKMGQLASGTSAQPFETVEDYENWVSRVNKYLVWCDTAIANMQKGMKIGYVLPKALTLKVIPQLEALANENVKEHLFYSPVRLIPESFSEEEKEKITEEYTDLIANHVIPEYQKMIVFFETEYLPACRETSGISAIPNGADFYQHRIKEYTTTDMTADEVFELGMSEVNRISDEMNQVKSEIGFEGDLPEFIEYVRNLKDLMPYTDPQQVIDHFNEIYATMKPNLKVLFDVVPKAGFEVRRTEAFREKSASAEYNQPSLDGSRPGIFYVPIPNVEKYNILMDEDLFLHEAIPGHHYQIALQQENTELPDFRKTLWYSAFGEGWALYSESLGKELGLYKDSYQYFGMLSAEMHRAIRLVVDAGMHSRGWTREKAIQFSLEHEAEPEESVVAEVERYMSWPGQALSYKIGQLKILELRKKAEKELGDQFDIKEFHNQVLEIGCVPLAILEQQVNHWIEKEKAAV